jgi:RNA polymerase sigma factor for flagellar operon FliA
MSLVKQEGKRASKALAQRDQLIEKYHGYVDVVVSQLIRVMHLPQSRKDEFISAGLFGLLEAAGRYKPERGQDFKSFAFLRIRGAVIDYIRTSCDLTGYAFRRLKAFEMAQSSRESQIEGRIVGPRDRPSVSDQGIEHLERAAMMFRLAAQSEEDEANAPEQEIHNQELNFEKKRRSQKIRALVATLPEKERTIIEQHYFQDRKLVDVATQFSGLSKSWVSRLHDRAIDMLREKILATVPDLAA